MTRSTAAGAGGPFDTRAADYAACRPTYPGALFEALAHLAPARRLAWDCGAGSGQAARGVAKHFARVLASDISAAQLAGAPRQPEICYLLAAAERAAVAAGRVDLVTAAASIHWFDLERFYAEVRRVLAPGGVIAVFSYFATRAEPDLQAVLDRYANEVVGPYWDARVRLPRDHYRDLAFPFDEVALGSTFEARHRFDLGRLVGFMRSWSGSQAYERATGDDPLLQIQDDLLAVWGDPAQARELCWPLFVRCGRVPSVGR